MLKKLCIDIKSDSFLSWRAPLDWIASTKEAAQSLSDVKEGFVLEMLNSFCAENLILVQLKKVISF